MAQTELGLGKIVVLQSFKQFGCVQTKASNELHGHVSRLALHLRLSAYRVTQIRVRYGQHNGRFFGWLGKVELDKGFQVIIDDCCKTLDRRDEHWICSIHSEMSFAFSNA